jgi:hypothetical protein
LGRHFATGVELIRESKPVIRLFVLASIAVATLAPSVHAQSWAQKMFKVTSHDFGTVARGAKAEFLFEMQNIFEEDIHIASVRTSCTCRR